MLSTRIGELAALGTASCWTISALSFETAGKRIGSLSTNLIRMALAAVFLTALHAVRQGGLLPLDAGAHAWGWLAVSGLVGFTFGDLCLFKAFVYIGPRLASVMMCLAPPFAALLGWMFLGERLGALDLIAMSLIGCGVAAAIAARAPSASSPLPGTDVADPESQTPAASASGHRTRGLLLAVGGALGQAGGLVLSKIGMGKFDPFAATQIRVLAGFGGFLIVALALRWGGRMRAALADRPAVRWATLGAIFGPFLGVGLSLVAVQRTSAGVAASLMATTPVLILPIVVLLGREKFSLASLGGALLAVAGVALLFA
ncbi:MAG TPA: DMT family transporter [Thermoanaerobaculia bacterium]|nr:DMT family transporter [Thermoanaerobaculia bacterium]